MSEPVDPGRRRLLVILGTGAATVAGAPVAAALLAPVRTTTVRAGEDYVDVMGVDEILAGHPLRVTLRSDRTDAWSAFRNVELGSAYLLKDDDGGVTAFSSACPHLGCAVRWEQKRDRFECPCHESAFARGGQAVFGPTNRSLERLQCRVENGRILVRFAKVAS